MPDAALTTVLRILRAEALLQARITGMLGAVHGISLNEAVILLVLNQAEGGRMRRVDLAQALGISQASVTRAALPLEKTGLVVRETDRSDARVGLVQITDTGRQRITEVEDTLVRLARNLFVNIWTENDIAQIGHLLGRLTGPLPGSFNQA